MPALPCPHADEAGSAPSSAVATISLLAPLAIYLAATLAGVIS